MALTGSVRCSQSVFQIYDDEAAYLIMKEAPVICWECEVGSEPEQKEAPHGSTEKNK